MCVAAQGSDADEEIEWGRQPNIDDDSLVNQGSNHLSLVIAGAHGLREMSQIECSRVSTRREVLRVRDLLPFSELCCFLLGDAIIQRQTPTLGEAAR